MNVIFNTQTYPSTRNRVSRGLWYKFINFLLMKPILTSLVDKICLEHFVWHIHQHRSLQHLRNALRTKLWRTLGAVALRKDKFDTLVRPSPAWGFTTLNQSVIKVRTSRTATTPFYFLRTGYLTGFIHGIPGVAFPENSSVVVKLSGYEGDSWIIPICFEANLPRLHIISSP